MSALCPRRLSASVLLLAGLILAGCQTPSLLPFSRDGATPEPVIVADASPERQEINARVYDVATAQVTRIYYDPEKVGDTFRAEAAARREAAVAAVDERTFYRALGGLMETLDDFHTNVEGPTARQVREARERGEASVAFGLSIVRRAEGYFVEDLRAGGPAEQAGVQIGWRLVRFNGADAGGSIVAVEDRPDSFVFEDETGALHEITMAGRRLDGRPPFEATHRAEGVVVLRFNAFDVATRDWLREQVAALDPQTTRGVILDLRMNGGGLLSTLRDVVGLFQGRGRTVAVLTGRVIDRPVTSGRETRVWAGPTAILIGPGSGSASELLAASFQETGRGPVVGRRSAGAVIASRSFNLPDGGELSVSINAILTGGRVLLEKVGVTPDVVVEPTLEQRRSGRDVTVEAAIAAMNLAAANDMGEPRDAA